MDDDDGNNNGWDIPSDPLGEILRRLPPLDRRRSRLVSRHWRDVVDSRAPARPGPAKMLVVAHGTGYVFDDVPGGSSREIPSPCSLADIVGTCNGLLCVVGTGGFTGGFILSNPVTGETLHVPLPTRSGTPWRRWKHKEYSFAHHPTTGLYKIVHFPVEDRWTGSFDVVKVYTLGEAASWRDVKVMSLDLKDERIAAVITLPAPASEAGRECRLTEAHGRLAVAAIVTQPTNTKTEVWVLEGGAGGRRWKPAVQRAAALGGQADGVAALRPRRPRHDGVDVAVFQKPRFPVRAQAERREEPAVPGGPDQRQDAREGRRQVRLSHLR